MSLESRMAHRAALFHTITGLFLSYADTGNNREALILFVEYDQLVNVEMEPAEPVEPEPDCTLPDAAHDSHSLYQILHL